MAKPSYLAQPVVTRLPVILEEISQGLLLIPRFQRPFVWKDEQRLRLVDSIEKGMPIGSLLVWRTAENRLKTYRQLGPYALPEVEEREVQTYVLDGHQRLSTLYGALRSGKQPPDSSDEPRRWPIYYDLESREFRLGSRAASVPATWLPLSSLYDPVELYGFQKELLKSGNEKTARRAEVIANRFKDYQIPVVPIVTEDLIQATESFQRVNSQGTKMSEVHMVNALMWSKNFDLNERLDQIVESLGERGWGNIETDILLDTIKLWKDLDIYTASPREVISALKDESGMLEQLAANLEVAIDFLDTRCNVGGPAILPYKYQLAILADAARLCGGKIKRDVGESLHEWFWLTTYTEYFSGMTSTQLRNAARHVRKVIAGDASVRPADLPKEVVRMNRFDFNSVRTRALVLVQIGEKPRFPDSEIAGADLVGEFGVEAMPKIFHKQAHAQLALDGPENRWIVPARLSQRFLAKLSDADEQLDKTMLRSQFISSKARSALVNGEIETFLSLRRAQILNRERDFVRGLNLQYKDINS